MNKYLSQLVKYADNFNRVRYNAGDSAVSDVASIDVMAWFRNEFSHPRYKQFPVISNIMFDIEMFENTNDVLKYAKQLDDTVKTYLRQQAHALTK